MATELSSEPRTTELSFQPVPSADPGFQSVPTLPSSLPLALVKAAHEDRSVKRLIEAYAAMDVLGESYRLFCGLALHANIWVNKHVRPDNTVFMMRNQGPKALGNSTSTNIDFDWAYGPIIIKVSVDVPKLTVSSDVSITLPLLGTRDLVALHGNLKDGVKGEFDIVFVKGSVALYLQNDSELWLKLEISGIIAPINGEFELIKL
ncbi:hypothetical protein FRC11_001868, partial [Ceratobasidium sp. 423]